MVPGSTFGERKHLFNCEPSLAYYDQIEDDEAHLISAIAFTKKAQELQTSFSIAVRDIKSTHRDLY